MDWFTGLEQRRRATVVGLVLLLIAVLAVTSLRDPMAYDSYWHLHMGQNWVEKGLSPWVDHVSFTHNGSPIKAPSWPFDAGLYELTEWFGLEAGFKFYKFASQVLVLIMTLIWLSRTKSSVLAYCIVLPVIVALLQMRATVRPELISYALMVGSLVLYERAKTGVSVKNMLPIVVLMLAWSNYHSSAFGYVIFFGLFIDLGIKQLAEKAPPNLWAKWLAWGVLVLMVGFMNPSLSNQVISLLYFPEEWKSLIQEYQSPTIYLNLPSLYIVALITVLTLIMLIRQRQFGYFAVVALFLSQALSMARIVTPAGIVILCLFAYCLSRIDLKHVLSAGSPIRSRGIAVLALILFLVALLFDVVTARTFVYQNRGHIGYFPEALVGYIKDSGKTGRVFNQAEIGGFLGYHLFPEIQVYIDGRAEILYPLEFYQTYLMAAKSADSLKEQFDRYEIKHAAIGNSAFNSRMVYGTGLMTLDFADIRYFLYSRGETNFPVSGLLWGRPYCWDEEKAEDISNEHLSASVLLPSASPIIHFLNYVEAYNKAADKNAYLELSKAPDEWTDPTKRFAMFRAIDQGMNELALELFQTVAKKEPKDYLAAGLAYVHTNRAGEAEKVAVEVTSINWDELEFTDLILLHGILTEANALRPLELFEPEYLQRLEEQVGEFSLPAAGNKVTADSFCMLVE